MFNYLKIVVIMSLFCGILFGNTVNDYEPKKDFNKKVSIAYYQGGDYFNYPLMLKSVIKYLSNYGWLEPIDLNGLKSSRQIWDKLADYAKSDYIVFKKDAFYDLKWDESKRKTISEKFIQRLNKKKDIGMIFALGTWAGQDLANDKIKVPTFVMSSSNPIEAKILLSSGLSAFPQIHAEVDKKGHKSEVTLFYKIFKFKTLGIVYEDSVQGKSYVSLSDIESVAKEKNFKIKRCTINPRSNHKKQDIIECYKKISNVSDAIYITTHPAYKAEDLESFISVINSKKIPTFSQVGQNQVKYGALMSISEANFKYVGEFHAQAIGRTLNGISPSKQSFIFEEPVILAINLETATLIDWDIPLSVIAITTKLYQNIYTKESLSLKSK